MEITDKIERLLPFLKDGAMRGRVLVLPEVQEQTRVYVKTDKDVANDKPTTSRVVAVSEFTNPDITVGKLILHSRHIGAAYEFNGKRYLVINSDEVMMIFKD